MHDGNAFEPGALRIFVVVVETGSMGAAAKLLNYSQPAVTRRIKNLEDAVGGQLLDRLARGVRPNPAGEAFYGHARAVLERLAQADQELQAIWAGRAGRLRVGAFATANIALLPRALQQFVRGHPDVEVTVSEARSRVSTRRLADGELDVAVVSDYPSGLPLTDGITTTPLLQDELHVAVHRKHRLAGAGTIDLRELKSDVWLQDALPDSPTAMAEAWVRAGFRPRRTIRVAEWAGKFGYVRAGLGVALVPELAAPAVPAELVLCRLGNLPPHRTVHVALPDHPLPAALALKRALADAVAEIISDRGRC